MYVVFDKLHCKIRSGCIEVYEKMSLLFLMSLWFVQLVNDGPIWGEIGDKAAYGLGIV